MCEQLVPCVLPPGQHGDDSCARRHVDAGRQGVRGEHHLEQSWMVLRTVRLVLRGSADKYGLGMEYQREYLKLNHADLNPVLFVHALKHNQFALEVFCVPWYLRFL